MRVLCVTPWFPRYAGDKEGNFVLDSVDSLADAGHEVRVLVTRALRPWRRDQRSVPATRYPVEVVRYVSIPRNVMRPVSNALYEARVVPALAAIAEGFGPAVIHAHTEAAGVVAVKVAERCSCASVVTLHGINTDPRFNAPRQAGYFRRHLARAGRIVIVGEPLREHCRELLGKEDFLRVVPNGVRLAEAPVPRRLEGGKAPVRLVSVSDLVEGKGVELTLDALAALDGQGCTGWRYSVVGEGPERPALERLAASLGLAEKIVFLGALKHSEVFEQLGKSDVFVLPSYREAFGIAYLEAMACGLLTIGVRGQGAESFIRHGETGLLVAPRDAVDLRNCLQKAIERLTDMAPIAARGAAFVRESFPWSAHATRLETVFSEVVAR